MASRQGKHIDTVAQEGNVFALTGSHILPSCATVSMCLS
jgi:hypothetical protein